MTGAAGAYVLSVAWDAKPGAEDAVADILRQVAKASAAEAGVIAFHVARDPEHPGSFRLFEIYRDQAAHAAHMETGHFKRLVLQQALPLLAKRERTALHLVA